MSAQTKKQKGARGEDIAAEYLQAKGYQILDRNAIIQVGGQKSELDLVAFDPDECAVVFVEVKYRSTTLDGGGLAAVTQKQIGRIRRGTTSWLFNNQKPIPHWESIRIDVMDVGPDGVRVHLVNVW